jgi:hypothetical protein
MPCNRFVSPIGRRSWLPLVCLSVAMAGRAAADDNLPLAETAAEAPAAEVPATGPPRAQLPLAERSAASPQLTEGDAYTIAVKRGEAKKAFGGNLVKATDRWIVLRRITTGSNESKVPVLSSIPKIGTAFRRTNSGTIEEDLWIPRDAAEIESHIRVANAAKLKPVLGTQPPTRFRCAMTLNENGAAVRRDGNLASIGAKGVILLTPGSIWTQKQRKVPHEEILCISISNYISDVRETQRNEE